MAFRLNRKGRKQLSNNVTEADVSRTGGRKQPGRAAPAFCARISDGWRALDFRKKRMIQIDVLLILVVLALYQIFLVPRDAEAMFRMALERSAKIDTCVETLKAETEEQIDAGEVSSLRTVHTKTVSVPVTVSIKARVGHSGASVKKESLFTVLNDKSSVTSRWYEDTGKQLRYLKSGRYWIRSRNSDSGTVSPEALLHLSDTVIANAEFARADGTYQVTVPAQAVGTQILMPFLKDAAKARIDSGSVVYSFNRHSKRLVRLTSKDLMVTKSGASKQSLIQIDFHFADYNRLKESDWKVPDKVLASVRTSGKKQKSYTLSMKDLVDNDMECYTVGNDIPAGAYVTGKRSGRGIITCLDGTNAKQKFRYNAGYGYDRINTYHQGKEVRLNAGDRIILKGKNLSIWIRPAD